MKEEYLGDGVYASYDGYHIWLDLRAQDDTTRIALEPPVLHRLLQFAKAVNSEAVAQVGDGGPLPSDVH